MTNPPADSEPATPEPAKTGPAVGSAERDGSGGRRRGRKRCLAIAGLLIVALGLFALVVVTRTGVTRLIVLPRLEAMLGVEIEADRVVIDPDGSVVLRGAVFQAPGVQGEPGEVLTVRWSRVSMDWSGLLGAGPRVRAIEVRGPTLRVSEDASTGALNIASIGVLHARAPAGGTLPTITATDLQLELGEHDATGYRVLRRVRVEGRLDPLAGGPGYSVSLRQTDAADAPPLTIDGTITPQGMSFELADLSLAGWPALSTPTSVRRAVELLDLDGRISGATLVFDESWSLTARLAGVGLSLPLDRAGRYAPAGNTDQPRARMTGVTGTLTITPTGVAGELDGMLEDLPYHVQLAYDGFEAASPFSIRLITRKFKLTRNPELLAFVPAMVDRVLGWFNNPTAQLDAEVVVERGPPTAQGPAPVELVGWLHLRHGEAAYQVFPQTVRELSGTIAFTQDELTFNDLRGEVSQHGSIVFSGRIAPLTSSAEATVRFQASGVSIDDELREALGPGRDIVLDMLQNRDRLDQLVRAGLVRTGQPDTHDPDAPPTDAQRPVPIVALGGELDIDATLHRAPGPNQHWTQVIDIHADSLTLVPRVFALPVVGRDVTVRLTDEAYELIGGEFTTVSSSHNSGGHIDATISGAIPRRSDPDASIIPRIELTVTDQPADAIALFAAAHAGPKIDATDRAWVQRVLTDLRLAGTVDATVHIKPGIDELVDLDAQVTLDALVSNPDPLGIGVGPQLAIRSGTLAATLDALDIDLVGTCAAPQCEPTELALDTRVELTGAMLFDATVRVDRLAAPMPVESLVAVFSREQAQRILAWRARTRPAGAARTTVHLSGALDQPTRTTISLADPQGVELSTPAGRLGMDHGSGSVIYTPGERIAFDAFTTELTVDGRAQGTISADGDYGLGGQQIDGQLAVALADGRFESPAVRSLVVDGLGPRAQAIIERINPRGRFDARVVLASGDPAGAFVSAAVMPHALTLDLQGTTVAIEPISGTVLVDRAGARTAGLTLAGRAWSADGAGSLKRAHDGAVTLDATLKAQGTTLDDQTRALLPASVRAALDAIELSIDGAFSARLDTLEAQWDASGKLVRSASAGSVTLDGASADVGVELTEGRGSLALTTDWTRGEASSNFDIAIVLDAVRAGGVALTRATARVVRGDEPGTTIIQGLAADCAAGTVAGDAIVYQLPGETVRRYEVGLWASDVRLGPVLTDLRRAESPSDGPVEQSGTVPADGRGLVNAELSLTGVVGDASRRRGRGAFRVGQGDVVSLPLVLTLVRVSNLHLPGSGSVDLALGEFFVEGDTVFFEQLSAFAGSVELYGLGTLDWPTRTLDLRFTSRSVVSIPLVTELVEGVRNQLMTLRVTGTTRKPVVQSEALPGASSIARRLLGQQTTPMDRRLGQIEQRAKLNRQRIQRTGDRVRQMVKTSHQASPKPDASQADSPDDGP